MADIRARVLKQQRSAPLARRALRFGSSAAARSRHKGKKLPGQAEPASRSTAASARWAVLRDLEMARDRWGEHFAIRCDTLNP